MKLNFNNVAKEICHREESLSREVNITDAKRVMKHFLDILSERTTDEWFNYLYPVLHARARTQARKSKRPDKKGR